MSSSKLTHSITSNTPTLMPSEISTKTSVTIISNINLTSTHIPAKSSSRMIPSITSNLTSTPTPGQITINMTMASKGSTKTTSYITTPSKNSMKPSTFHSIVITKTSSAIPMTTTTILKPTEVIFEGKVKFAVEWHPALENKSSEEYKNVSAHFLTLMTAVYENGELKDAYLKTEIISITQGSIDIKYNQTFRQPETVENGTVIEVDNATVINTFEKGIKELERNSSVHNQAIQVLVQTFNITHAKIELRELPRPRPTTISSSTPTSSVKTTRSFEVTEIPENDKSWLNPTIIGSAAGGVVLLIVLAIIIRTVRKRQRDKDSILWDDGLYMEPTFTKLDPDGDSALSTYNPIYNLNGGKLEIDSTQAH